MSTLSSNTQSNKMRAPRVLIATAREWLSGARLALALQSLGCEVQLLSPAGHPARLTDAVSQWTPFRQMRPFRSIERALDVSQPDALILADEIVLHYALLLSGKNDKYGEQLRNLINTTAAGISALELARTRLGVLDLAHSLHVPTPETVAVSAPEQLASIADQLGFPLVLKSDGSAGGQGVRVAQDLHEAEQAWSALHRTPSLLRVLKRGLMDREWMHVRSWLRRQTFTISAQKWVRGHEMTSMAVAHQGRMLASVEFEVAQSTPNRGPSSVLRVVENAQVREGMSRVISQLGINGFCGFDFMCDPHTGEPLMIEMNTRTTQLSHLTLGAGKDLVAAYVREVLGRPVEDRPAATSNDLIALFPQELHRDAASKWMREAWMDIPWESDPLIRFALGELSRNLLPARPVETALPQLEEAPPA